MSENPVKVNFRRPEDSTVTTAYQENSWVYVKVATYSVLVRYCVRSAYRVAEVVKVLVVETVKSFCRCYKELTTFFQG